MVLEAKALLAWLLLLAGGEQRPRPANGPPQPIFPPSPLPGSSVEPGDLPVAPPWPVSPPAGLPPFPSAGWEYDEPPSQAIMARAVQLLPALWAQGAGTHTTEFVGGHYVTFLAEIVAGGKKGVTAWRVKSALPQVLVPPFAPPGPPPAPAPAVPAQVVIPTTPIVPVNPVADAISPRDLQTDLNALGYGPLAVDGIIGPLTKAAVRRFQADNPPLAVDGIAGPQTKSVILAKMSSLHGSPVVVQPTAPVFAGLNTVRDVQHALNVLGFAHPALAEDNINGPKTGAAVRAFQAAHPPLVVDGVAGPQTKAALGAALSNLAAA